MFTAAGVPARTSPRGAPDSAGAAGAACTVGVAGTVGTALVVDATGAHASALAATSSEPRGRSFMQALRAGTTSGFPGHTPATCRDGLPERSMLVPRPLISVPLIAAMALAGCANASPAPR